MVCDHLDSMLRHGKPEDVVCIGRDANREVENGHSRGKNVLQVVQ